MDLAALQSSSTQQERLSTFAGGEMQFFSRQILRILSVFIDYIGSLG